MIEHRSIDDPDTQCPFTLGPREVHVWLAFQHASPHDRRYDAYARLLNAAEREQESRFHFERDRIRYRVTRAMARRVLSNYLRLPPESLTFEKNAYGRPELGNEEARRSGLTFNLSHTQDVIMMGVTRGRMLGVDVERVCAKRASADLAARFFAPSEGAEVVGAPHHRRDDLFFQYWTLKESYIKARGMGMSIPLAKFGFTLRDEAIGFWIEPELNDRADRWDFVRLQPTPAHWAAVCVERDGPRPPALSLHDFATLVMS